jgi:DNA-binding Lrp family transcriptional regulator
MSDFPIRIIELLRGCPSGLTSKDIAKLLGTSPVNLSSRLSKLAAYGIIDQVRGARAVHGSNAAIYRAPIQPDAGS